MRTVLFANNRLGARVARWLARRGDLVGLVLHRPEGQQQMSGLGDELGVPTWHFPDGLEAVAAEDPECALSVLFGHRLSDAWLAIPSWLAVNVHPGLLPHNAGANPNVWPLVDGSPAGTTVHVMSRTIDGGPILAQDSVVVTPSDTAASLYAKLEDASFDLLTRIWADIRSLEPVPQPEGGSYHRSADLATLDPEPHELALIDRLRARTFPPYGAEFDRDGRRWRIRVEIEPLD